jgi:magnesium transporter
VAAWIDLLDPDDSALDDILPSDIHPTTRANIRAPIRHGDEPRPRIELQGGYVFGVLVAPVVDLGNGPLRFQEIDVIVDHHRLVSVRKTPDDCPPIDIADVRSVAEAAGVTPGMALYALVDEIAERFLDLVDRFDDEIDELEDMVEDCDPLELRNGMSQLRHDILHVRRVLSPTRDFARSVLDDRVDLPGEPELFPRDVEVRFADAYDKLLRAADGLELSRDLLAGVRDYHQSKVANDQNEVMKRLTAIASILLVPTFIVGLYGQNFDHMPELHWRHGYGFSWFVIFLVTVGQVVYFRRKRWI